MKYWLQEKRNNKTGFTETTVYKQGRIRMFEGSDNPHADWWPSRAKPAYLETLFSADLPADLTIGDAARLLRMKKEETKQ